MLKRIIAIYGNYKKWVAVGIGMTFLLQGIGMISPYIFGRMMDSIIRKRSIGVSELWAIVPLLFSIVDFFIRNVRRNIDMERVWFPIQEYLRMKTINRYFSFSMGWHKSNSSSMSREVITNGEHSMQRLAEMVVRQFIPMAVRILITVGILLCSHLVLGLVVLTGITSYGLLQWKKEKDYTSRIHKVRDTCDVSGKTRSDLLMSAQLIKSYSKEEKIRERYRTEYLKPAAQSSIETNKYINWWDGMIAMIIDVTQSVALLTSIYLVYQGKMTLGGLTTATMWCSQAGTMIQSIGNCYQDVLREVSSVKKFFDLIDTPPTEKEIDNPVVLLDMAGFIAFKNVSFAYPTKDGERGKSVVKNVSALFRAGEKVAIVGPSGSGKTTLITLLLRGYDPTAGAIEVDGHNLRNLSLKDYYRHIAVVDQSSLMMDMSIRDNIQLGAREPLADEDILSICRLVELEMDKFDKGLDTSVGEMGNAVSGGERQRLAIARALAANPKILVLDEATASLDAIVEAKIKRAIEIASRGRTTIVIAHRLSTVQHADRIFVMENGEIAAAGTHRELLRTSGLYMQLVQEQMIEV
jgi:ABC-type multidrug transport system fused ATPase/permease subunit